jgi:hypothetical protein
MVMPCIDVVSLIVNKGVVFFYYWASIFSSINPIGSGLKYLGKILNNKIKLKINYKIRNEK